MSVCLSDHPSIHPPVHLSIYLSVPPSIYLSIHPFSFCSVSKLTLWSFTAAVTLCRSSKLKVSSVCLEDLQETPPPPSTALSVSQTPVRIHPECLSSPTEAQCVFGTRGGGTAAKSRFGSAEVGFLLHALNNTRVFSETQSDAAADLG